MRPDGEFPDELWLGCVREETFRADDLVEPRMLEHKLTICDSGHLRVVSHQNPRALELFDTVENTGQILAVEMCGALI